MTNGNTRSRLITTVLLVTVASVIGLAPTPKPRRPDAKANQKAHLVETYGRLPLSFEANRGQADGKVQFLSRGAGYALFLSPDEAVLALTHPARWASTSPDGGAEHPSHVHPYAGGYHPTLRSFARSHGEPW